MEYVHGDDGSSQYALHSEFLHSTFYLIQHQPSEQIIRDHLIQITQSLRSLDKRQHIKDLQLSLIHSSFLCHNNFIKTTLNKDKQNYI